MRIGEIGKQPVPVTPGEFNRRNDFRHFVTSSFLMLETTNRTTILHSKFTQFTDTSSSRSSKITPIQNLQILLTLL
jgi:hypothetical protein